MEPLKGFGFSIQRDYMGETKFGFVSQSLWMAQTKSLLVSQRIFI